MNEMQVLSPVECAVVPEKAVENERVQGQLTMMGGKCLGAEAKRGLALQAETNSSMDYSDIHGSDKLVEDAWDDGYAQGLKDADHDGGYIV